MEKCVEVIGTLTEAGYISCVTTFRKRGSYREKQSSLASLGVIVCE